MKTSVNGLNLIKKWEGKFLKAYHGAADRPGLLTIGYGHTDAAGAPKVTEGMTITDAQATYILQTDLIAVERSVTKLVTVPLTQNQFDALVSFVFNLGAGSLARSSLLKKVNAKDYKGASGEFMKWTQANGVFVQGLANRRSDEVKLWNSTSSTMPLSLPTVATGALVSYHWYSYWPYILAGSVTVLLALYLYGKYKNKKVINNV